MRIGTNAAFAVLAWLALQAPSYAQEIKDTPTSIGALAAEAAALVGKKIDYDAQKKIFNRSPHAKAADWRFGLEVGNEGELARAADTRESGKGKLSIRTEYDANGRCGATDEHLAFTIDMDPRLNADADKDQGKHKTHADAWESFADHGAFAGLPRKIELGYNWDAVALDFKLDPSELARHGELALCRTSNPPGASPADCAFFSLKGFQRAFDFLCQAK
jgi:hypothetical protein